MKQPRRSAAQHTPQTAAAVRALRRCYLCIDLTDQQVEPLAHRCRRTGFAPGEHVFFVGDDATHMYVLEHGQVREYVVSTDGHERTIEIHGPPAVFGDPALFVPERRRIINVVATKPSIVIEVPRSDLLAFLHQHPTAMERMLGGLAAQIREMVDSIDGLSSDRITQRLAYRLIELTETYGVADKRGTRITLSLSQGTLASAIGATRPNVNRAVRQLVDQGELFVDGDSYVLTNPQRLRAAIAPHRLPLYRRNRTSGTPRS